MKFDIRNGSKRPRILCVYIIHNTENDTTRDFGGDPVRWSLVSCLLRRILPFDLLVGLSPTRAANHLTLPNAFTKEEEILTDGGDLTRYIYTAQAYHPSIETFFQPT